MARTTVLGQSGRGKSWKLGEVLEKTAPKFTHSIHFDPEDEEAGLCIEGDDGSPPIYRTFYVDERAYHGEFDIPATIWQNQKVRVVPDGLTRDEMRDLLGVVCDTGMKIANRDDTTFLLSVDEAHVVMKKSKIDERVNRAVTGGRKRGLEYAISSQRAQNVPEDVLSQSNWGIYFQLTGDRDLGKVQDSTSFDAERLLPKLGKYECIVENRDRSEWKRVDTTEEVRHHPHLADDDGVVDDYLDEMGGDWKSPNDDL